MTAEEKIAALVALIHAERAALVARRYPNLDADNEGAVRAVPGKKYTKIDMGPTCNWSGRYMVENDTGRIYGIKAYGVIHRGHQYGTLDTISDWYWGDYTAVPRANFKAIRLTA